MYIIWAHYEYRAVLTAHTLPGPPLERGLKRKRGEGGEESDEESQSGTAPPINDIYRARQQKRAHTAQASQSS